ncbi:hypothetical protein Tco_1057864 [Tanacetum coccineum]|uniref:Uncharacterized protein n=1 Tax=Tanacetum coccineum TaxID=301880 RepID=A0ABQ5H6K9_9ASTR
MVAGRVCVGQLIKYRIAILYEGMGFRAVRQTNGFLFVPVLHRYNVLGWSLVETANKKCVVNADVFRIILDLCPRVEDVEFTDVPNDDTALTFLIDLGYKERMLYPELNLGNLVFSFDHKKEKKSRRENMPYPRFTKTMLTEAIKQSESYQMFIKYSTGQNPPKKSRGKGSQGKKTADTHMADVDISEESEPKPAKKKTTSRRVVKKKVIISAKDNIIPDLDVALELGKSISQTEAEEAEAAKKVYATQARIMTKPVPEPARRRKSGKVAFDPLKKLKCVPSLTLEEQEVVDIMQALKESRKSSRRQYQLDEEKDDKDGDADDEGDDHISDTQDADDEDAETESDEDEIYKYKIRVCKDKDEEMLNDENSKSEKGGEEVSNAAKADAEKISDVKDDAKKAELPLIISHLFVSSGFEVKYSLKFYHISLHGVLNVPVSLISEPLFHNSSRISSARTRNNLPPPSVSTHTTYPQQTTTQFLHTIITTVAPSSHLLFLNRALSAIQLRVKLEKDVSGHKKIDLSTEALAALKIQVPTVVEDYLGSRVGDVFQKELQKHTVDLIQKYSLQYLPDLTKKQTPTADQEQESKKSPLDILKIKKEQVEKQQMLKFTIKSTDKATLEDYDLKSALYQSMNANKSFNRNPANYRLYHALIEAFIKDENAMVKGVADTVKDHKRKHDGDDDDDDKDPPAIPNRGKKTKRRRTKELESSKKPSNVMSSVPGQDGVRASEKDLLSHIWQAGRACWAGSLDCALHSIINPVISFPIYLSYVSSNIYLLGNTAYEDKKDTSYWELVKRVFL